MQERMDKELLGTLRNTAHADSLAYQFESLKHLAIANSAGLAFCAAILANTKSTAGTRAITGAASLCAFGLVIAVGLLVWRWIWGTQQASRILDLYIAADARIVTRDEFAALALPPRWAWIPLGLAGWSLVFFCIAVLLGVVAVRS